MSENIKISFIPKKPIAQSGRLQRKRPVVGISFVLAFSVMVVTMIGAGAEIFYKYNRDQIKLEKLTELQEFNESLENGPNQAVIEEVRVFQMKTERVRELLAKHVAPSLVFDFIESTTLSPITFSSFDTIIVNNLASLSMQGVAPSYEVLAYYSLVLEEQKDFINTVSIENIALNANHRLNFLLKIDYNLDAIRYALTFKEENKDTLESFSESLGLEKMLNNTDDAENESALELLDNPESDEEVLLDEESNFIE